MDNDDSLRGRLRSDLSSKGWWYGAIGGVLTTMIGIALTIGVGAYVQKKQDKEQAREMMFNVVCSCLDNEKIVAMYDTAFHKQSKEVDKLVELYHSNGNDLSSISDDTLRIKYMICLNGITPLDWVNHAHTENYFFSAQMMHQFGNTKLYTEFADFVQFDKQTFAQIEDLINQWYAFTRSLDDKQAIDRKRLAVALNEMIEDHELTDYGFNVRMSTLSLKLKLYRFYSRRLLKVMDATQSELDDYIKSNSTADNEESLDLFYLDSDRLN